MSIKKQEFRLAGAVGQEAFLSYFNFFSFGKKKKCIFAVIDKKIVEHK
jgi:hypothetical protein